jgi:hypothetical protein
MEPPHYIGMAREWSIEQKHHRDGSWPRVSHTSRPMDPFLHLARFGELEAAWVLVP